LASWVSTAPRSTAIGQRASRRHDQSARPASRSGPKIAVKSRSTAPLIRHADQTGRAKNPAASKASNTVAPAHTRPPPPAASARKPRAAPAANASDAAAQT
jgi:hypothetical protein